ncbi:MAG: hypothetical protein ACE368_24405 [Paracoccaceae bacterium]
MRMCLGLGATALVRRVLVAALCCIGLSSLPAQAVIITVGGVDYDVLYFEGPYGGPHPSFNDNIATLTDPASAPWWGITPDGLGGTIDAQDFASAYVLQVGAPDLSVATNDNVRFVYENPIIVSYAYAREDGLALCCFGTDPSLAGTNFVYAYTVPIPSVPEIDGNALAKALFILFALGAWLHTRRARVS